MTIRQWSLHASDPMGRDLVLVDDEGKKMDGLLEVSLYADRTNGLRATVEIMGVAVNAIVLIDAVNFSCPSCHDTVLHECVPTNLGGQ